MPQVDGVLSSRGPLGAWLGASGYPHVEGTRGEGSGWREWGAQPEHQVTYSATSIPRIPGDSLAPGEAWPLLSSSSAPSGRGAPCPPCPWGPPGTPASAQHGRLPRPLSPTLSKQEAPTVPLYSAPRKRHLTPGPVQAQSGCNLVLVCPPAACGHPGRQEPGPNHLGQAGAFRMGGVRVGVGASVCMCVCDSVCVWE